MGRECFVLRQAIEKGHSNFGAILGFREKTFVTWRERDSQQTREELSKL